MLKVGPGSFDALRSPHSGVMAPARLRLVAESDDNPVDGRRKRSDGRLRLVHPTGPSVMANFATVARRRRFVVLLLLGLSIFCWLLVAAFAFFVLKIVH